MFNVLPHGILIFWKFKGRSFSVKVSTKISTSRNIETFVPQGGLLSTRSSTYTLMTFQAPDRPRVFLVLYADEIAVMYSN